MSKEIKFSPTEQKVLRFAEYYHKGQKRLSGKDYITHKQRKSRLKSLDK